MYNTDFMEKKENRCYAILYYRNNTYSAIRLPCYPETISDSASPSWNPQQPMGRVGALVAYTGTSNRKHGFSFTLHREMECGTEIEDVLQFLRKTIYPQYDNNGLYPPITKFVFGKMVFKGYVDSMSFDWQKPIIDGLYQVCNVSVNITDDPTGVFGVDDLQSSYNPFGETMNDSF